jgi:hypothetical protein
VAQRNIGTRQSLADSIKGSLKNVAETFAKHERVDSVSLKHVDEAYSALARLGLNSKRFWQRTDTWTAFSGLIFGGSLSLPDAFSSLAEFTKQTWLASFGAVAMIIGLVIGASLFCWAHYHGTLPKKPGAA